MLTSQSLQPFVSQLGRVQDKKLPEDLGFPREPHNEVIVDALQDGDVERIQSLAIGVNHRQNRLQYGTSFDFAYGKGTLDKAWSHSNIPVISYHAFQKGLVRLSLAHAEKCRKAPFQPSPASEKLQITRYTCMYVNYVQSSEC